MKAISWHVKFVISLLVFPLVDSLSGLSNNLNKEPTLSVALTEGRANRINISCDELHETAGRGCFVTRKILGFVPSAAVRFSKTPEPRTSRCPQSRLSLRNSERPSRTRVCASSNGEIPARFLASELDPLELCIVRNCFPGMDQSDARSLLPS
jgi:hypothetical protein